MALARPHSPHHPRLTGWRWIALGVGLMAVYALLGRLGLELAFYQERATIIWAPSGLAVAAVWLFGPRIAWAVFGGALLVNLWVSPNAPLAALIALGNSAEALLAGWLVRRCDLAAGLHRTRDVLVYFASVVIAAPLVAAANGALWLVLVNGLPLAEAPLAGLTWWLGDAGGVLVVASVAIAFARPPSASPRLRIDATAVALTFGAALVVALGPGVSSASTAAWASVLCVVLPYPAVTWAAMRLGVRGASLANAVIALAAVLGTAAGAGPFQTGDFHVDVLSLWPLLATLSVSALLLASSLEEQRQARAAHAAGEARLGEALKAAELRESERDAAEAQGLVLARELERSRRLGELGLLAGGIAHDFNNLLTVVRSNADFVRQGAQLEPTYDECLRDIDEAGQRGRELTDQLLAYAGRRPPPARAFDLAPLAAETARLLMPRCPRGTEMRLDIAGTAPVYGDPVQLRQVLMNLIINAFDAMEGRVGLVRLAVARQGEEVLITVADDGPGMSSEVRVRLFEPFFSTKEQGRGMGLAGVRGIVNAHGGGIDVVSQEDSRGAAFVVRLPAAASDTAIAPPVRPLRRVLVVDDDAGVRRLTALILERAGFEVALAAEGSEALRAAEGLRPDVALIDVALQGESGIDVMGRLRAVRPGLPVVLMSGYHELAIDPSLPLIDKPFEPEQLVALVRGALHAQERPAPT